MSEEVDVKEVEREAEQKRVDIPCYESEEDFERAERMHSFVPNNSQIERMNDIMRGVIHLTHCFQAHCPNSRERSLAVTKLEEAKMWANRAILVNEIHE